MIMMHEPLLTVDDLAVTIDGTDIIANMSFSLDKGQTLALVGESGCGKSITALSLMGLLPSVATITKGSMKLDGRELVVLSEKEMRQVRGNDIAMIFQEPSSALDPLMTVGAQIVEAIQAHRDLSTESALERAVSLLDMVGIPEPVARLKQYPFELSGGMCQRIMIASALSSHPAVLIADEPTTALDVTIQAQILDLMRTMRDETGTAIVLITHDMGIVADMADQVAVMYAGRVVEQGDVFEIFRTPRHPYTHLLLKSIPSLTEEQGNRLHTIRGVVPDAKNWPSGCRFHTRCPYSDSRCETKAPFLARRGEKMHWVACWNQLSEISNGDTQYRG